MNEQFLFDQIYTNPQIFEDNGKEMCIVYDVVLEASVCGAVFEGFYSLVKSHKITGCQKTIQRTVADWLLSHMIPYSETIRKTAILHRVRNHSRGLTKHRILL